MALGSAGWGWRVVGLPLSCAAHSFAARSCCLTGRDFGRHRIGCVESGRGAVQCVGHVGCREELRVASGVCLLASPVRTRSLATRGRSLGRAEWLRVGAGDEPAEATGLERGARASLPAIRPRVRRPRGHPVWSHAFRRRSGARRPGTAGDGAPHARRAPVYVCGGTRRRGSGGERARRTRRDFGDRMHDAPRAQRADPAVTRVRAVSRFPRFPIR